MKTKVVVVHPDKGARILINPEKVELFKGAKNALINPDISKVIKFPLYQWTVKDGALDIADKEEIKRREILLNYVPEVENIIVQKDTEVEVVETAPEIIEVEQQLNLDDVVNSILDKVAERTVHVERIVERPVLVEKPLVVEVEKPVVVEKIVETTVTRDIPVLDIAMQRKMESLEKLLLKTKEELLEQALEKAIADTRYGSAVLDVEAKLDKFIKYTVIVATVQAIVGLLVIAFIK